MPGERREAHLDRLPVADVGEHLVEHRQRRRLGRHAQPGLVQQRGEPERLQRDRLAARVRPADHERAQRAEVEVDRHRASPGRAAGAARRAAAPRPRSRPACAAPAARERRARDREVDRAGRLDERDQVGGARADRRRELAQDPRHLLALGARRLRRRLFSSTTSSGSTNSVCPEAETSWTIPGTLRRELALTANTGRPPRWVTKSSCRCSRSPGRRASRCSSSVTRCRPVAQLPAQLAQQRARRCRAGRSRPPRRTARSRRRAGAATARSRAASPARSGARLASSASARVDPPPTVAATSAQRQRRERAAARGVLGRGAHVVDPCERRLGRQLEERGHLGGQRLAARDLLRDGRTDERARQLLAVRRLRRGREPSGDGRESDFECDCQSSLCECPCILEG